MARRQRDEGVWDIPAGKERFSQLPTGSQYNIKLLILPILADIKVKINRIVVSIKVLIDSRARLNYTLY
jgi:hypothetical protein